MSESLTPVVLAAFGTRTRARKTYSSMHKNLSALLPGRRLVWAYTSRFIRHKRSQDEGERLLSVPEALEHVRRQGYESCVVQSLHVLPAWEFHNLIDEVRKAGPPVDVSLGLPILCGPRDYEPLLDAIGRKLVPEDDEAVVIVGHGTDHPAGAMYHALASLAEAKYGDRVWMEMVQWAPNGFELEERVRKARVRRVRFVPFMTVAGEHMLRDVMGDHDEAWRVRLDRMGVSCRCDDEGLGYVSAVCDHLSRRILQAIENLDVENPPKRFQGLVVKRALEEEASGLTEPVRTGSTAVVRAL